MGAPREPRGGFILVSALAVLAILTALVGGVTLLVRSAAADARLARDELVRDGLTRAGLELAAYQAIMLRRPQAVLTEQQVRLDAGTVTLSVVGESGKVDLNGADPELLAALWRASGAGGLNPAAFAARVIDWRDKDDKRGQGGAEREDYASAGVENAPADAPFESVDDLQNVLGVSAQAVRTLKPFLTVHNPQGRLSVLTASREVLRILPKINAGTADRVIELRRTGGAAAAQEITNLLRGQAKFVQTGVGRAFQVRIAVEGALKTPPSLFTIVQASDENILYYVTGYEPGD